VCTQQESITKTALEQRNALQHTATHCNTLQHTATHCNTLQHTATHCNTLQHSATHCNSLLTATYIRTGTQQEVMKKTALELIANKPFDEQDLKFCSLQHTATHCNTLHHTATRCNTLQLCVYATGSHEKDSSRARREQALQRTRSQIPLVWNFSRPRKGRNNQKSNYLNNQKLHHLNNQKSNHF